MQNKNKDKFLISVVIPAKNNLNFLKKAVDSVLCQSLSCQIIVVDDGSFPSLLLALRRDYPNVFLIRNKTSKGPGAARNQGLKQAEGDYIAFLDSDDYWKPNFAKIMINACKESKGVALCFSSKIFSPGFGLKQKIIFKILNSFRDFALFFMILFNQGNLLQDGFYLAQVSHMLFDKDAIRGIKFDEFYKFGEDWKFILEVQKRVKVKIVPQKFLFFRYHHKSLSFKNKEKWLFYRKLLKELPPVAKKGLLARFFSLYIHIFSKLD